MALLSLPPELLARALSFLKAPHLAACAPVCAAFHHRCSNEQPQQALGEQARPQGLVEQALRLRAEEAGRAVPDALWEGEVSWVQLLLLQEVCGGEQLPALSAGNGHTLFVDDARQLLSCGGCEDDEDFPGEVFARERRAVEPLAVVEVPGAEGVEEKSTAVVAIRFLSL